MLKKRKQSQEKDDLDRHQNQEVILENATK